MNIQSGTYYWPDTFSDKPTYPALDEDITCDVLIVGGGSSGAQCAYYLADQGLDVVVIESPEKSDSGARVQIHAYFNHRERNYSRISFMFLVMTM